MRSEEEIRRTIDKYEEIVIEHNEMLINNDVEKAVLLALKWVIGDD